MNLLHLDSSILANNSVSRALSAAVVARLTSGAGNKITVAYRDLSLTPLLHLSGEHIAAAQGAVPEAGPVATDMALSQDVLGEFLSADTVVLGTPMYNFTIPSQLKAWVDRILVAGQTFRYTAAGAEGLAGNKRVVLALARGGLYGAGSPSAIAEHAESYLRVVFGFVGITKLEVVVAEGVQLGPDHKQKALDAALDIASKLDPM